VSEDILENSVNRLTSGGRDGGGESKSREDTGQLHVGGCCWVVCV